MWGGIVSVVSDLQICVLKFSSPLLCYSQASGARNYNSGIHFPFMSTADASVALFLMQSCSLALWVLHLVIIFTLTWGNVCWFVCLLVCLFGDLRPGITLRARGRKWRDSCKEWSQPTKITDHQVNGQWKAICMCRKKVSKGDVLFHWIWKTHQKLEGWENGLASRIKQKLYFWMSKDFSYYCFSKAKKFLKKNKCLTLQNALKVGKARENNEWKYT